MDQLYTLSSVLEGRKAPNQSTWVFFTLEKVFDHVPCGCSVGGASGVCVTQPPDNDGSVTIPSMPEFGRHCWQKVGFTSSEALPFVNNYSVYNFCGAVEAVQFGCLSITLLLFEDDVVVLAPSSCDLQLDLERFTTE